MGLQPAPNEIERNKASTVMRRIAADLLKQSKASQEKDKDRKSTSRKDILSLLVQANTMPDLPEAQRLSDEDVMARAYGLNFGLVYLLAQYVSQRSPAS